ncbi:MAG TPA: regulatory protein RecX, partial [Aquaticitalea sp.]|nr:regulatory protein RecX [Aquaticitalea sp.]
QKMESFCAYQERCHKEVIQKLIHMNMIPEVIDVIVVHLISNGFLNEERFAKTFARGKFRIKKWGKQRITQELKQRDITKTLIVNAIADISDHDYLNAFHELAEKKATTLTSSNIQKNKKQLTDYLLYRGWESHLVYEKVRELYAE